MSLHVIKRESIILFEEVFKAKLSPAAFRVYCQFLYIAEKQQKLDAKNAAVDCCMTDKEFTLARQELELAGFIGQGDGEILVNEIKPSTRGV